jgi:hypothetical protein
MSVAAVTQTIQLILAPVVMVTACAILSGGLIQRYAAINDRLRAMARERLDILFHSTNEDQFAAERLIEIDTQVPMLIARHHLAHRALFAIYFAVMIFIGDMFVIAMEAISNTDWLATLVVIVFLLGTGMLFLGIVTITTEVSRSQRAVEYEVVRVLNLMREKVR